MQAIAQLVIYGWFVCCAVPIQAYAPVTIELYPYTHVSAQLASVLPEKLYIEKLTYTADCLYQEGEFAYYTAAIAEGWVDLTTFIEVCELFQQKKKFKKISIQAENREGKWHIHFDYISEWTFCRLDIKGFMTDRDRYRQYYSLAPGEPFLVDKHLDSIERMYTILEHEGYFAAKIIDTCRYDPRTKQVVVQLHIVRGSPARIKSVDLEINGISARMTANPTAKKMLKLLKKQLNFAIYKVDALNHAAQLLRCYLLKKGFFHVDLTLETQIENNGKAVRLKFFLKGNKEKSLQFFGNHALKNDTLIEYIQEFGPYVQAVPPSLMAQELVREYVKRGYWDAQVSARLEKSRHYFLINEGEKACIQEATFKGLSALSQKQAEQLLGFIGNKNCDEHAIELGIQRLKEWYEQQGFWECSLKHSFKKCGTYAYCIELDVNEGRRRVLRECTVANNPTLTLELQNVFLPLSKNTPCNSALILQQRMWLRKKLDAHGFIHAQIAEQFHEDQEGVWVEWHITHDEQPVLFGKTILQDSTHLPFAYIMRELQYREGDTWSYEAIKRTVDRLKSLRLFHTVRLFPLELANDATYKKVMLLQVVEDSQFEARLRLGAQQVSKQNLEFKDGTTYKIGGSFLYKNPTNHADCMEISADVTRFYQNFCVLYDFPWFAGKPIDLTIKGYSNHYTQPLIVGSDKPLYKATQQGMLSSFSRSWQHIDAGFTIGVEWMEISDISQALAFAIDFSPVLIDQKVPFFYIEQSVVINNLNDQLNPSWGGLTAISLKGMFPHSSKTYSFLKVLLEHSHFFSLNKMVFGCRIRFGHIFNQPFSTILPIERFYLGGQNSLRSYEPDFGPPLGVFFDKNGRKRLAPQGGRSMINSNLEMRFPLFYGLGGVVFQDIGMLSANDLAFLKGGVLLAGTGFGLRYQTPVGPLRFDIGWKWRRQDELESSYAWFLTLGHAF